MAFGFGFGQFGFGTRQGGASAASFYGVQLSLSSHYLVAANQASINVTGDFTAIVWFDSDVVYAERFYPVLLFKGTSTTSYGIQHHDYSEDGLFSILDASSSRTIVKPNAPAILCADQIGPNIFGVGRAGATQYLYFNGTRYEDTGTAADLTNTEPLIIGNYSTAEDSGGRAPGVVRRVALYNRALSAAEAGGFDVTVPASGRVAYWPFTEGTGSTVADVDGGADFTIAGGDWVTF